MIRSKAFATPKRCCILVDLGVLATLFACSSPTKQSPSPQTENEAILDDKVTKVGGDDAAVERTQPTVRDANSAAVEKIEVTTELIAKTSGSATELNLPFAWIGCVNDVDCTTVYSPCAESIINVAVSVRYEDVASAAWKHWCGDGKRRLSAILSSQDAECSAKKICERTSAAFEKSPSGKGLEELLRESQGNSKTK